MLYIKTWKEHKFTIIPMSAFVAWLWAFPLFGVFQSILEVGEASSMFFNVFFLTGIALGFLFLGFTKDHKFFAGIFKWCGITNLILMVLLITCTRINNTAGIVGAVPVSTFAFLMGFVTAIFFVFWGATITFLPVRARGHYMGAMLATAALFSLVLSFFHSMSLELAVILCGLLLLLPTYYANHIRATGNRKNSLAKKNGKKKPAPIRAFWFPLILILLSFYILSWVSHQVIFPAIREQYLWATALGQLVYGLTALAGGYALDRLKELEYIAIAGLVLLGSAFFFLPVAARFHAYLPLQIILEGSYALIDLFIWVCISFAVLQFKANPLQYYGQGLFLNIFFVLGGIVFDNVIQDLSWGYGTFYVSVIAGAVLFCGIFPALALRSLRRSQTSIPILADNYLDALPLNLPSSMEDSLTPREIEVLKCILLGMDNASIQKDLGVSKNTLKSHIRHIHDKLGVNKRSELILKARRQGE